MKEKIIEIIRSACALEENNITLETKLQDLSLDSLSFVEAIVDIELAYGIEFEIEEAEQVCWETVGDVIIRAEELYSAKK